MEWLASSPDLNPIEHLWDQLGRAVRARVTNTTMLADLRQMLVKERDAIPQQCVTRLVTSMRSSNESEPRGGARLGLRTLKGLRAGRRSTFCPSELL